MTLAAGAALLALWTMRQVRRDSPDAKLRHHAAELLGHRAVVCLHEVVDLRVDAYARLDGDRVLVHEVGELRVDLIRAPRRRLLEHEAGQVEGGEAEDRCEHQAPRAVA